MARRLATIAERVRQKFQPVFGVPRGRVQMVLVDQTDLSNGWARPVPYDEIEITAVPPSAESLIGNTTDWLELVFTHEYTHILHLDRTRGFMQGIRRVFGRVPLAFPNSFLPVWQVEGIATFEESRMTGEGRVPAGDFRAIVDTAAAAGRFEPIDRAAGGLIDWPSGNAPYAYGAYFHQFLADRYGAEPWRRSPMRPPVACLFRRRGVQKLFGRSESELWKDSVSHVRAERAGQRHRREGAAADASRVRRDGPAGHRDGRDLLRDLERGWLSRPDGAAARRCASPGCVARARESDLGARGLDRVRSGRARALDRALLRSLRGEDERRRRPPTDDGRARRRSDLSPDGRRIVCTVQATGRRALALLDFNPDGVSAPRVLIDEADADFTGPLVA